MIDSVVVYHVCRLYRLCMNLDTTVKKRQKVMYVIHSFCNYRSSVRWF